MAVSIRSDCYGVSHGGGGEEGEGNKSAKGERRWRWAGEGNNCAKEENKAEPLGYKFTIECNRLWRESLSCGKTRSVSVVAFAVNVAAFPVS